MEISDSPVVMVENTKQRRRLSVKKWDAGEVHCKEIYQKKTTREHLLCLIFGSTIRFAVLLNRAEQKKRLERNIRALGVGTKPN